MQQEKLLRTGAIISLCTLGVLVLMAAIFYKERMLLCDASHISFEIINKQTLQIQQYRYGAFITQMIPLAGTKLGLSLKAILLTYSLSFNVFYFLVATLLVFGFKTYRLTILMAFYYVLIASDTFYWPNNEVHQGVAWMFLFFGAFIKAGRSNKHALVVLILFTLAALAIFTHPLVIIPFVFLWGFLWISKEDWPLNRTQSFLFSALLVTIIIAKTIFSKYCSSYDSQLLEGVKLSKVFYAITSPMALDLIKNAIKNFWLVPILFAIGVMTIIKQKRYLLAFWTGLFCIGYFVLICMTFQGYLAFYTESELMAGAILATAPFVFFSLPQMKGSQALTLLVFIFIVRLAYIGVSSQKFTKRIEAIDNVLAKMKTDGINKLILVKNQDRVEPTWMLDWGLPTESVLLSALKGDKPQTHFLILTPERLNEKQKVKNDEFISCFTIWDVKKMNASYFALDTTQVYTVRKYEEYIR